MNSFQEIIKISLITSFIIVFLCGTIEIKARKFNFEWPGLIKIITDKIISRR